MLVNVDRGVVLTKADFVIGCSWKAFLVVSFAILTLTLFAQSSIISPSGIVWIGGLSVSANRTHHVSTGRTIPGGPFLATWLSFPGTAIAELFAPRVFKRLAWLKITNPSGWMAAYINKIEKQRMTRKTNMRTMMANKRRHVCLAAASGWNSSTLSSSAKLTLSWSYSNDGSRLPFRYLNNANQNWLGPITHPFSIVGLKKNQPPLRMVKVNQKFNDWLTCYCCYCLICEWVGWICWNSDWRVLGFLTRKAREVPEDWIPLKNPESAGLNLLVVLPRPHFFDCRVHGRLGLESSHVLESEFKGYKW